MRRSLWIPFLAITATVANAALVAYMPEPGVYHFNGIAIVLCLAVAVLSWDRGDHS